MYYTTKEDIIKIISCLIFYKPQLKEYQWIDPVAADGRWEEIAKTEFGIDILSYDINPIGNKVKQADFLNTDWHKETDNDIFFIGNPPFSLVRNFVKTALKYSDWFYFLGGSCLLTGTLSNHVEYLQRFEGYEGNHSDRRSKLQFVDTFGSKVPVWCCGALFNSLEYKSFERYAENGEDRFAVSPKVYCTTNDKRIEVIKYKN